MNLTPKKDFQGKKVFADAHRELVVSTQFREALHAALIEYVMTIGKSDSEPAANYHRVEGAREFIQVLLNIAEMPKTPTSPPPANLDHSIR